MLEDVPKYMDNDKIHKAQFVRDWPPQSPELNPIKSLWDVLELTLHGLSKNKQSCTL